MSEPNLSMPAPEAPCGGAPQLALLEAATGAGIIAGGVLLGVWAGSGAAS
jgi:hypothetical protein